MDEALEWKKRVFLSPSWNQFNLALCFHMASSLSSQQFSSTLVSQRSLITSGDVACNSNHSNLFCKEAIFYPTCPQLVIFHTSNLFRQNSMQDKIEKSDAKHSSSPHASITISSISHLSTILIRTWRVSWTSDVFSLRTVAIAKDYDLK